MSTQPLQVESSELRRRGDPSAGAGGKPKKSKLPDLDLRPPPDLDRLWTQLLEDNLSPEKRASLQAQYEKTESQRDRYLLFLEYSSYLRKPPPTGKDGKKSKQRAFAEAQGFLPEKKG